MNLADIRKKAQNIEPLPQPLPAQLAAPWQAPAQPAAFAQPADFEAGCTPEPAAPAQFNAPELAPSFWECTPTPTAPEVQYHVGGVFDPASVILKGRELAGAEAAESGEQEQSVATVELLCFRVANEEYAIDIMDIKEIIKPREVTEVPRVPAFVRGILSLRGNIIPIFDMRLRLGLDDGARSERERIIVVKRGSGFCGIVVDEVVQVVRIPAAGLEAPPVVLEGMDREFVVAIGRVSDRMLILLDMEKVLDINLF